ncbi:MULTISPECIES: hypothetical protein [unclassified Paenibacillus]|uniref:hypothetical protein n=1 Tax=unclassified Paenibacillus TaxID=185978 RepID=UPI000955D4E9|nr:MULTISPECIES: hypothetical protein [unclassified Paenibacillus]ASS68367.2 hypothetical protein CIC07_21200 [Paenibacillus sp. RUD330]SIR30793.1 hypothetical protein SAMN05880555_3426 [Paenibacillus sp. RU4X]SIR42452.1 hypothetical protein SAMN05880570_3427 [Paenibacillus sp. RU4T]
MEAEQKVITVKTPVLWAETIGLAVVLLVNGANFSRHGDLNPLILCMGVVVLILLLLLVGIRLARLRQKPRRLTLSPGGLKIGDSRHAADEIGEIRVYGVFGTYTGILRRGRRVVPPSLYFRFVGDEDQGMRELERWAAANGIKMVQKNFWKWI